MFDSIKNKMGQFQKMQRLMQDENVRALFGHPKVQEAFRDAELRDCLVQKNYMKLMTNPKFRSLFTDTELSTLFAKVNVKELMDLESGDS